MKKLLRPVRSAIARALQALPVTSEFLGPPKEVISNTAAWVDATRQRGGGALPERWQNHSAYTLRGEEYFSTEALLNQTRTIEPPEVVRIPNARFYSQCVITPDDEILLDISATRQTRPERLKWILKKSLLPRVERLEGDVAIVGDIYGATYYHWTIHALGRLAHILKRKPVDDISTFLVSHLDHSFHHDSLRRIGIPSEKIRLLLPRDHLKADAFLASTWIDCGDPTVTEFLRRHFLPKTPIRSNYPKRIYLSRSRYPLRRILNEEAFTRVIQNVGFERVYCEDYSFEQQIEMFSQVDAVIAPHGGSLTNLVFTKPGTKVIECFGEDWIPNVFYDLSQMMGLDYHQIRNSVTGAPPCHKGVHNNFEVSLPRLEKILGQLF